MAGGERLWLVVGGAEYGGILVKQGQAVKSTLLVQRLATGALVRQAELVGERLRYELVSGSGPATGWVSRVSGGKELLQIQDDGAPAPPAPVDTGVAFRYDAPTPLLSLSTPLPSHIPERLLKTLAPNFGPEVYEHLGEVAEGEFFGLPFPFTGEQILEFGAGWLTKAFHAAGTLPKDNSVKRIVDAAFFPGGGAGLKARVEVEYEKPSDDLHTMLFYKLPLPETEKNRHLCIQMALEGTEILFNQYVNASLPFRTPKFYFGDMSCRTSNFVLISESLTLASSSTRGKRQEAFQFEAAPLKGMDSTLNDAIAKYYAIWRTNAIMAAWCHCGKLGKQFTEVVGQPPPQNMMFPTSEKIFKARWEETKDFVLNVGTGCFPKDIATEEYMAQLGPEALDCAKSLHCFNDYLKGLDGGLGLMHINCQVDNAFFWVDDHGRTDCGLLDFGGMFKLSHLAPTLGWNLMSASPEFRAYHLENASRLFVSTLAEFGGPKLDAEGFIHQIRIADFNNVTKAMTMVVSGGFGGIYDFFPRDQWKQTITMDDPRWLKEDIGTMMLRGSVMNLSLGIQAWKMGNYYSLFTKWRDEFGKKPAAAKSKAKP
mmetsp:Transcript_88564/g.251045  ORF Transcript_88564/g.251045 Transcript_88564/m.251045 type:complete len:597 (-) Transcript_88564:123-1913(-)